LREHPLKARSLGKTARCDALIILDEFRHRPAHRDRALTKTALQGRALGVLAYLP